MKSIAAFFLFTLLIVNVCYAWPFEKKATESTTVSKAKNSKPELLTNEPVPQNLDTVKKNMMKAGAAPKEAITSPALQEPPKPIIQNDLPKIPDMSSQMPVFKDPPKPAPTIDTRAIENQINEIIRMNNTIKNRYDAQAKDIQRITEQARLHQKLLRDVQSSGTDELVNREKINIIGKETAQNRQVVEEIQSQRSVSS